MLEGEALDGFMDRFWSESDTAGDHTGPAAGKKRGAKLLHKDAEPEELEEYELKEDGVYITPVHWGKVEKRTWFSLLVMLLTVPLMLYLSVVLFH